MVELDVSDATSGFGAFREDALEPVLPLLNPKGFKLLLEILAKSREAVVIESPIIFVDRQYGRSKFTTKEVVMFLRLCSELRHQRPT